MKIPFLGAAYQSRSLNFSAQRCVNMYLEFAETENADTQVLYGTPGLKLFSTLTTGNQIRGQYTTAKGRYFAVSGNTLFEADSVGIPTIRGTLNTSSGTVRMSDNGTQVIIVDGFNGYILTLASNVLTQITDLDFPSSPTHVGFLDQYFIVNQLNTQQFQISALSDGTSWSSLDIGTAEASPDIIQSLLINNQNIWLFGDRSIEIYYNSGNATFPFERIPGGLIEIGTLAKYSPAKLNNNIYWLGKNENGFGTVYVAVGYQSKRVSTHPIEKKIGELKVPTDAVGWAYEQEGHQFYILTFLTDEITFCFDQTTGQWHERAFLDPDSGQERKHRGLNSTVAFNKVLVGDHSKPLIYEFDLDTYTDNGDEILRLRSAQNIDSDEKRVRHNRFEIVMETGVGTTT